MDNIRNIISVTLQVGDYHRDVFESILYHSPDELKLIHTDGREFILKIEEIKKNGQE